MPSPAASVAMQICFLGAKLLLDLLAFGGRMPAVDGADRVAPVTQMSLEVLEGVLVLGEDQQLAAAVLQLSAARTS